MHAEVTVAAHAYKICSCISIYKPTRTSTAWDVYFDQNSENQGCLIQRGCNSGRLESFLFDHSCFSKKKQQQTVDLERLDCHEIDALTNSATTARCLGYIIGIWVSCFVHSFEICYLPRFTRCFAKLTHQINNKNQSILSKLYNFLTIDPLSFFHKFGC